MSSRVALLRRAARRASARFRLHRIEWARFHAPMEVPEQHRELYQSMFELSPDLKTRAGFRARLRLACLRYVATWSGRERLQDPDSSILARELQPQIANALRERVAAIQRARQAAGKYGPASVKTTAELADSLRDTGFAARVCVHEFVLGYHEGVAEQKRAIDENDDDVWAALQKDKVSDVARSLVNTAADALARGDTSQPSNTESTSGGQTSTTP